MSEQWRIEGPYRAVHIPNAVDIRVSTPERADRYVASVVSMEDAERIIAALEARARLDAMREILRDLVESRPVVAIEGYGVVCPMCWVQRPRSFDGHRETCPLRRAYEALAPASAEGGDR